MSPHGRRARIAASNSRQSENDRAHSVFETLLRVVNDLRLGLRDLMQRSFLFQALTNSAWFWFVLLCCLAAAGLIVMLLNYERRLVSRRVGITLLCLRLTTIAVLLFTFMEPVISAKLDQAKAGRIVVAVDLSESMTTTDRFATQAELLRWARAIELIGNAQINERLDNYQQAFDAGREPQWVAEHETQSESKRETLSKLRRDEIENVFEQVRQLPRKEIAKRLLLKTAKPLLTELAEVGAVEIKVFAGQAQGVDLGVVEETLDSVPASIGLKQSDFGVALDVASGDTASQVTAVVLVTDGRHNGERDPVALAQRLAASGAAVFPVMIGTEERPRDIAIVTLDAPQVVFKNDSSVIKARLTLSGYESEEIAVTLEKPDGTTETKNVRSQGKGNPTAEVEFSIKSSEVGRFNYTLQTDVRPQELRDDNNRRSFAIQVVDDKSHVLLIDGEARWEFRFIDRALERDERIELTHVVFNQPYIGVLPEPFFPRRMPLPQPGAQPIGRAATPLGNYDLVIVGDVSAQQFGEDAWNILEAYVRDDGGSLVLLAGKNHFPKSHTAASLARMFPMRDLRLIDLTNSGADASPQSRGMRFKLTPDGERQTMFQLNTDIVENRNVWSQLPGHSWGILGEARAGATVLATARNADPENLNEERKNALAVHQHYGFGQVLWLGIDSTWRWRHRVGDKYHHRFWGQVARWAAENKASAGNAIVRLSVKENPISAGADALVSTRWEPRFIEQNRQLKAFVEVYPDDGKPDSKPIARQPLLFAEGRPFVSESRISGLPSGAFKLRLVTENGDIGPNPVETTLYVQEPATGELSELNANRDLLTKIATAGQGKLILPHQVSEISSLIRPPESRSVQQSETSLYDHWLTLLLFFTLLTTEWVVRKLNGLP